MMHMSDTAKKQAGLKLEGLIVASLAKNDSLAKSYSPQQTSTNRRGAIGIL
jgi:hypothetical protein